MHFSWPVSSHKRNLLVNLVLAQNLILFSFSFWRLLPALDHGVVSTKSLFSCGYYKYTLSSYIIRIIKIHFDGDHPIWHFYASNSVKVLWIQRKHVDVISYLIDEWYLGTNYLKYHSIISKCNWYSFCRIIRFEIKRIYTA